MISDCSDEKLETFSKDHFTYINQIFGDQTVRQIISEVFPNKKFDFNIENTGEEFEHSFHHILINKKNNEKICSVDNGYQNIFINKNDTLCQSYSLLTYFNKNIVPDQKQRQMDMIKMYRKIISNKKFIRILDEIIYPDNNNLWIDFTNVDANSSNKKYITMNKDLILQKINDVLNNWEEYGYWYFIGNGKCPSTNIKPNPLTTINTVPSTYINLDTPIAMNLRTRQRINGGKKKTIKKKIIKKKTTKKI
jgi:hypothetical protein